MRPSRHRHNVLDHYGSSVQWLEDDHTVRERWRTLVTNRQAHLRETS